MSILWYPGIEFTIDPNATLAYSFDWSDWLDNDAKIDSFAIIASAGVTVVSSASNEAGTVVSVLLSGVANYARESVTCRITTDEAAAQIDDRTINIIGASS